MNSKLIILWCILTVIFTLLARVVPSDGLLAFDWNWCFSDEAPVYYPPWTSFITSLLSYHSLIGMTMATFSIAVLVRAKSLPSGIIAFMNLPLLWTLFLGQIDGIVLLGIIGLPVLLPLVLTKPHIAAFAVLARKRTIRAALLFVVATLVIWKFWPVNMLTYRSDPTTVGPQDMALGWMGVPLFVYLLKTMPRGDVDWWMLAGTTVTPFLIPYNLLPLMPAISRLPLGWAILAAIGSWLPLLSNWIGPVGWKLGWIGVGAMFFGLRARRELC